MQKFSRLFTAEVNSIGRSSLSKRVSTALSRGWELYGDPVIGFDNERGFVVGQTVMAQQEGKYPGFTPFDDLEPMDRKVVGATPRDKARLESLEGALTRTFKYQVVIGAPDEISSDIHIEQNGTWRLYGSPAISPGSSDGHAPRMVQALVQADQGGLVPIAASSNIKFDRADVRILSGKDDSAFCKLIEEAINSGWHKYGNPMLANDGYELTASQTIIRPEGMS